MKARNLLLCTTICALPLHALAQEHPSDMGRSPEHGRSQSATGKTEQWTESDTAQALRKLHDINMEEIQIGQLAQQNGASEDVTDFGKMLVKDHQKADEDVMEMARAHQMTLDSKLPAKSEAASNVETLRKLKGAAFDQKFASMMVQGHEKAISQVKMWKSATNDEKLSDMLDDLLPTLTEHRDKAHKIMNSKG